MARYALIETATGKVANIIALKDSDEWEPPQGHYTVVSDSAAIGMVYAGGQFSWPAQSPSTPSGGSGSQSGGGGLGVTVGAVIKL